MEAGAKRTLIARIAAGLGAICGIIGGLVGTTKEPWLFTPRGWGIGGILLLLIAIFLLLDGVVSFEKSDPGQAARRTRVH